MIRRFSNMSNEWWVVVHVVLAIVITIVPALSGVLALGVVGYGVADVYRTRNRFGRAHLYAAYIVGMEVFLRMTNSPLPWEFAKYAVILLLLAGLIFDRGRRVLPALIFLYFFLLLISLPFSGFTSFGEFRNNVSFNLSGPFSLCVATIYFYQRSIEKHDFFEILKWVLMPIITMTVFVILNAPSLSSIDFAFSTYQAGRQASLFGTNQVATVLGVGCLIITMAYFAKESLFRFKSISFFLFGLFLIRGFLTFSRGGLIIALLALFCAMLISYKSLKQVHRNLARISLTVVLLAIISIGSFNLVDDWTGGALTGRYAGAQVDTRRDTYLTGRDYILKSDIRIFADNPLLGVGPGHAQEIRHNYGGGYRGVAAHIEPTRMMAEHGVFGIFALIIILFLPGQRFIRSRGLQRFVIVAFTILVFGTMGHSAMRLVLPGFFYGLMFVSLTRPDNKRVFLDSAATEEAPEPEEPVFPEWHSIDVSRL